MSSNKLTYKPKKATFTSVKTNKGRVFTPVNKRAHFVAKKVGKRTKITVAELKATNGKGSYKFYEWRNGELKAIKF